MSALRETLATLTQARQTNLARLETLRTGNLHTFTQQQVAQVDADWAYWRKRAMRRKTAYLDVESEVLDGGLPMSREELRERVGVEDEDELEPDGR